MQQDDVQNRLFKVSSLSFVSASCLFSALVPPLRNISHPILCFGLRCHRSGFCSLVLHFILNAIHPTSFFFPRSTTPSLPTHKIKQSFVFLHRRFPGTSATTDARRSGITSRGCDDREVAWCRYLAKVCVLTFGHLFFPRSSLLSLVINHSVLCLFFSKRTLAFFLFHFPPFSESKFCSSFRIDDCRTSFHDILI